MRKKEKRHGENSMIVVQILLFFALKMVNDRILSVSFMK